MAGQTSRQKGAKGGQPPGRKNDKTLLLEAEHEAFQQLVLSNLRPLFDEQLSLAKGLSFVYRVSVGPRGGRSDPELVTDPDELHEASVQFGISCVYEVNTIQRLLLNFLAALGS